MEELGPLFSNPIHGGFLNGFLKLASTLVVGGGSILGAEEQRNYT